MVLRSWTDPVTDEFGTELTYIYSSTINSALGCSYLKLETVVTSGPILCMLRPRSITTDSGPLSHGRALRSRVKNVMDCKSHEVLRLLGGSGMRWMICFAGYADRL